MMKLTLELPEDIRVLYPVYNHGLTYFVVTKGGVDTENDVGSFLLLEEAKNAAVKELFPAHQDKITLNQARALVDELTKEFKNENQFLDLEVTLHASTIIDLLPHALKYMDDVNEPRPTAQDDTVEIVTAYLTALAIDKVNK